MPMPQQKPGRSKQDYRTPPEFLDAVKRKLEITGFDADLAADDANAVSDLYFTKDDSAFDAPTWKFGRGWNWLNPPYSAIGPWVARAFDAMAHEQANTAVLIPASIGANWWRDHVHGKAMVLALNGRITFVGCDTGYPKDCALLLYSPFEYSCINGGDWPYDIWSWTKP